MAVKVYNDIFLENDEILNRFSLLGGGAFKQMNKEDNDYGGFILSGGKSSGSCTLEIKFLTLKFKPHPVLNKISRMS